MNQPRGRKVKRRSPGILGLYDVRKAEGDGALVWAPDFPAEAAGSAISEFLALFPRRQKGHIAKLDNWPGRES